MDLEARGHSEHPEALRLWLRLLTCTQLVEKQVRAQLREQFDLVLVDGPPWDGRPEVVALGCACDAVYLCLPEAAQETSETADLLQVIPEQGANLCGCVLTSR